MFSLSKILDQPGLEVVPLALDPMSALLAKNAGFEALYVGGGALGYLKGFTEANLMLNDFISVAHDIRTACSLPLILDGAAGWGDPMHMRRTIPAAEAAGYAAIELEDQLQPKRAHHHAGLEHVISSELMEAKLREASKMRKSADFKIIGRTNTLHSQGRDEAVRRLTAYHAAGADLLMVPFATADELRFLGKRLPAKLAIFARPGIGGIEKMDITIDEMAGLGVKLLIDPLTPLLAMHNALADSYAAIKNHTRTPNVGMGGDPVEIKPLNDLIGLEALLQIERDTVEDG